MFTLVNIQIGKALFSRFLTVIVILLHEYECNISRVVESIAAKTLRNNTVDQIRCTRFHAVCVRTPSNI